MLAQVLAANYARLATMKKKMMIKRPPPKADGNLTFLPPLLALINYSIILWLNQPSLTVQLYYIHITYLHTHTQSVASDAFLPILPPTLFFRQLFIVIHFDTIARTIMPYTERSKGEILLFQDETTELIRADKLLIHNSCAYIVGRGTTSTKPPYSKPDK